MDERPSHSAAQDVLDRLLLAHQAYFDVERDHAFGGRVFDGYAELHSSASKYVLVKRAKLWETSSHEYMFFVLANVLDRQTLEDLIGFMTTDALEKVRLEPDHMNSFLTLVIIAESLDEGIERMVSKTRFRKNFTFGLKGWADLRLCVVDLSERRIITNAMGKDIAKTLEANAFISAE